MAQQLALRQSPILLYEGGSNVPYITGCVVLGGVLTLFAISNAANLADPRAQLGSVVLVGFGVFCVGMQVVGLMMFSKV